MRRTSSGASWGRPTRRDFHAQKLAKPRRCQAMTVAGRTIASASDHRDHRRQTTTQNARSMGRSRGREVAQRRTQAAGEARGSRRSGSLEAVVRPAKRLRRPQGARASRRGSRRHLIGVTGESLRPARYAGPGLEPLQNEFLATTRKSPTSSSGASRATSPTGCSSATPPRKVTSKSGPSPALSTSRV
jgi:hypothetical protein